MAPLAHGHILIKPFQPDAVALGFRQPAGHLEPEGDRFAVDGMGRPIISVPLWASSSRRASARASSSVRSSATERFSCRARPVSSTSLLVMPTWMCRPASPTCSLTLVRKAMTSWRTSASISRMRSTSKPALALIVSEASWGTRPRRQLASVAAISTSASFEFGLLAPDAPISGRV